MFRLNHFNWGQFAVMYPDVFAITFLICLKNWEATKRYLFPFLARKNNIRSIIGRLGCVFLNLSGTAHVARDKTVSDDQGSRPEGTRQLLPRGLLYVQIVAAILHYTYNQRPRSAYFLCLFTVIRLGLVFPQRLVLKPTNSTMEVYVMNKIRYRNIKT